MMPVLKRLPLWLAPVVLLFLASCSEDFKVASPYKPITVVYGLLNVGDTAQYIRIQKAFLDESKSALDMARVPDSNYFDSLDVHLKTVQNGIVIFDEPLRRVDLNAEGYRKDTGTFFNAPSWAWKTTRPLDPANRYRITVRNAGTGDLDSAETPVIANDATSFLIISFYNTKYELNFPAANDVDALSIDINTAPLNAQTFEGILRFRWISKTGTGTETHDSADYHFATATVANRTARLAVPQAAVYTFLRDAIGPAPAGVDRYMDRADIFIWAAAPEFATFQERNGVAGGLTADQIRPIYTNIQGKDVLGLFSSRAMRSRVYVKIAQETIDSMKVKTATAGLHIVGRTDP